MNSEKDNEGFYYIRGRLKRFSKIFGVRINLDEIEILIKKLKIECICTGNDKILSFYLIDSFDKEEMTNKISKTIGIHRSAIHLKKIEAIPRNSSGKILYSELDKYA